MPLDYLELCNHLLGHSNIFAAPQSSISGAVTPSLHMCGTQAVPKLLWELGASRPSTSEAALHLLLDAGRTAPAGENLHIF